MKYTNFFSISLLIFFIDRLTKYSIVKNFKLNESIGIIPPYFHMTYITNTGAAFGILQDFRVFFIVITIISIIAILYYFHRIHNEDVWSALGLSFVFGGAISNFYDRLFLGSVIDFLDLGTISWRWPSFNIADIAICTGVGILIIKIMFEKEEAPVRVEDDQPPQERDECGCK